MSIGIGAYARLLLQDEERVLYEYGGYNLNNKAFWNRTHSYDGCITIQRSCFVEPEIHRKRKKMPSGKKKVVTKRIPVNVDYRKMIKDGFIEVENCSNCWETTEDEKQIDVMALCILDRIVQEYQKESRIPESISYNV